MIKSRADGISKSKKKIGEGKKENGLYTHNLGIILAFFSRIFHNVSIWRVIVAAFAVILAFIILELNLRIFEKKHYDTSACQSLDSRFHYVMIPNSVCRFKSDEWDVTYKINSLGLRDEEVESDSGERFRILLLGDSFAQGHGVEAEDSFGEILEEILKEEGSGKFEVVNAGVFGYSPLVEYLYLKKAGLEFNPDLVIFSFSLTDFWEDRQRFFELRQSYPLENDSEIKGRIASADVEFNWEKINSGDKSTVLEKSKLKEEVFKLKQLLKKKFRIYQKLADYWDNRDTIVQQDIIYQGDIDRDILALVRGEKISDNSWQELWKLPLAHIQLSKELLDDYNVPLVVVLIPDAFQVSSREWPGRKALGVSTDFYDPRGPWQNEMKQRLMALNIPNANLLDDFKRSNIYPLYFTSDGHFNRQGHRLTAKLICMEISNYVIISHLDDQTCN